MNKFIFIHIILNLPPKVNGFSRKCELYIQNPGLSFFRKSKNGIPYRSITG